MDIDLLVKLTARAWSLTILAALCDGVPGRQAPLLAATGAGRTALGASLDHLKTLGLLERNPGHGHPLRPEFRLTPAGAQMAPIARRLIGAAPGDAAMTELRRSWTVPVLALTATPTRFSTLRSGLAPVTDRALSQCLHRLEARDWLQRDIDTSSRRPFPTYQAINEGRAVHDALCPAP